MSSVDSPASKMYFWEDFEVGVTISLGSRTVTAEEIVEFASEFDPQPMHLDEAAGKASLLGDLGASGWHVCSIAMRMMYDAYLSKSSSQGAPGVDYVKWRKPVLAGDTLAGQTTVLEKRLSRSRPGLGFVTVEHRLRNQHGDIVTEMRNTGMFLLRGNNA